MQKQGGILKEDHDLQDEILKKMSKALDEAPSVVEFRGLTSPDTPNEMMLFFWFDNEGSAIWHITKENAEKVANKLLEMAATKGRIIT